MILVRKYVIVFSTLVSYQKQIEKKCLLTFWIEKKPFKTIRTSALSPWTSALQKPHCLDNFYVNLPFFRFVIFFFLFVFKYH